MRINPFKLDIVDPNLGSGGQGRVEKAVLRDAPHIELAVKHMSHTPDRATRVKALVDLQLPRLSPYLAAPLASQHKGNEIVHIAPLVEGHDLTEDNRTFPENLELAYHLVYQFTVLEEQGIAHGDIAPSNIRINDAGEVALIDFDNARLASSSVPLPDMVGQHHMLAPELRGGSGHRPDIYSDRFAMAVILNLLLLRRHPAGDAQTPKAVSQALSTGRWPEQDYRIQAGEMPIAVLGSDLITLFDAAFSLNPQQRPSANDWREAISNTLQRLVIHDCAEAFVLDPEQSVCPHCQGDICQDQRPVIPPAYRTQSDPYFA